MRQRQDDLPLDQLLLPDHAAELIPGAGPHHAPPKLAEYPGAARVHRLQPLIENHPPARGVPGVLQRQGADLALLREQTLNPVHSRRYQPPLQLAQHRAANPPLPPRGSQADPHHPRPVTGDGRGRHPHQFVADDRSDRGLMRPDGGDQIGQAKGRRLAAGRRVIPQPDSGIEVIGVKVTDPPRCHRISVPPPRPHGRRCRQRPGSLARTPARALGPAPPPADRLGTALAPTTPLNPEGQSSLLAGAQNSAFWTVAGCSRP